MRKKKKTQVITLSRLACGNCILLLEDRTCPINQHKRELTSPSCFKIHENYQDKGYEPVYKIKEN